MKQIALIGLIVLGNNFLFCQSDTLQREWSNDKKQIVAFSYNWPPFVPQFKRPKFNEGRDILYGEYGVSGIYYKLNTFGNLSAIYERYLGDDITFTANLSYLQASQKWELFVDENSPHHFIQRVHFFRVMTGIQLDYVRNRHGAYFFTAELGMNYAWNNAGKFGHIVPSYKGAMLAFQIWVFGANLNFTENLLFRFCLGFGTRGIFELGFGYRF